MNVPDLAHMAAGARRANKAYARRMFVLNALRCGYTVERREYGLVAVDRGEDE